ncbi:hypothetical protein ACHWQZ_G010285 [Mnemiopsis leidyi]
MTSVPLPSCQNGNTAKREKSASKYFTEDCSRTRLPRYNVPGSSKMNVFQSISSFLRKNKKVPDRTEQARKSVEKDRVSLAESTCNDDKKVEEDWAETSEVSDDNRDDIAFVRQTNRRTIIERRDFNRRRIKSVVVSTFRQSVKRAMGWRKSQRKAVNKRKKENIQNSKLLTGGTKDTGDDEFYDDTELDVVVVTDTDGMPDDPRAKPSSSSSSKHSKIPRRRNSTKRPAVSLKSAGFFSQSVASKRSEGGKTVTARTNKASELREVAIKKKLENSPAQSAMPEEEIEMIPVPAPARRKARTSFRTKKGISRKPVQKKEIKPAQNKASQLRAKIHQEEGGDEETRQTSDQSEKTNSSQNERSKEPESRRTDRFSSVAIKTPAPSSDTRDPLSVAQSPRRDSATVRTSGRAVKTVPQKPTRSKIPSSSSTSSNIPSPSPRLAPSSLPLSKSSDDFQTRKYSGRSEKTSSNIPKPRLSSPLDPTKELVFIPLDSVSLPLPGERVKIDEVTRKRKIQRPAASPSVRPVSNIFDGGAGDLPPSNLRRQCSTDDSDSVFTVHVNKTPARSVSTTPKPRTSVSKPKLSSSVPNTSAIPSHIMAPRKNSTGCDGKTAGKPKQVQNLSNFKRQNSIDSSRRSKKGIPAISLLSESCPSESSDNTCSYDSCRSLDEDDFSLSRSPPLSDSPKLSKRRLPVLISTDDLETQKEKLRTPKKRSGSIRVKQVRTRKSWLRPEVIDPEMEKVKSVLSDEVLIIEDLISGHQDILQTLSSRTLVLKNMTSALRRNDTERAARMCISLCFPRSHSDSEFKTMRRACQCNTDDLALFQNCLSLLLVEREKLTLPVVEILLSKVRFTFEVLGSEVLRGNIGEILKLITGSFGTKIAHRHSTPGLNYRLQEIAESCYQELIIVQKHVLKLAAVDYSPELMALKKTLELFDL